MSLTSVIDSVFAGGMGVLDPEGQRSGIFKRRVPDRVWVDPAGIVGDEHGDPRVHGGPEKAVHHYAAENYEPIARAFAGCASALVPGSLGENISARGLSEHTVHIGDVFRAGRAVLQVSQPRKPCWKINHRFGVERMSNFVSESRITGWYYRVLEPGFLRAGDEILLLDRSTERFSVDEFLRVQTPHRPEVDDLVEAAGVPGLAPAWRRQLEHRANWLRTYSGSAT